MNQPILAERRLGRRIPYRARVRTFDNEVDCRTTNISVSGLYLQRLSGQPFFKGERVELLIDLPIGTVRALGEVVNTVNEVFYQGAAVVFVQVSDEHRARLADFVHNRRGWLPRGAILARIPIAHRI